MISLSPFKLIVVAAVIILLMGPDKLPEMAHRLGASWRALKRLQERMESEVREAIPDLPSTGEIARMARSPVSLLNQLADRVDKKDAQVPTPTAQANESAVPEGPPLITPPPRAATPRTPVETPAPPPDPSLN
ncbi:MAG TPA: twin-arginine translocase TatA/TatE family subunit [Acidimicrobiales bacterium]|nr:twin-arginine translocase TatA/TatE family subunit [Acidimicrobiales bacterium]